MLWSEALSVMGLRRPRLLGIRHKTQHNKTHRALPDWRGYSHGHLTSFGTLAPWRGGAGKGQKLPRRQTHPDQEAEHRRMQGPETRVLSVERLEL